MRVLNPQEVGEGFCMALKVRTIHSLSFVEYPYEVWLFNSEYRFICQSAGWSNFQQSLLCWTYWVIVDSTEIKVNQTKWIKIFLLCLLKTIPTPTATTTSQYKFPENLVYGHFHGKVPNHVLRQPVISKMHVLSSHPIQVEEKHS